MPKIKSNKSSKKMIKTINGELMNDRKLKVLNKFRMSMDMKPLQKYYKSCNVCSELFVSLQNDIIYCSRCRHTIYSKGE